MLLFFLPETFQFHAGELLLTTVVALHSNLLKLFDARVQEPAGHQEKSITRTSIIRQQAVKLIDVDFST